MFKMKNVGKKHCIDSSGWGMVKIMHSVLPNVTKTTFAPVVYIGISTNKVITIDNSQWFSIHFYVV